MAAIAEWIGHRRCRDRHSKRPRRQCQSPLLHDPELAPLKAEGSGIVLTATIANALGLPMFSTYAADKAALRSRTRSLAWDLLPRKIRVNAVGPGVPSNQTTYQ
jgi:NAD(P)-dependent dehydrogenase (short-subunit alcohol dehydrogenase family)